MNRTSKIGLVVGMVVGLMGCEGALPEEQQTAADAAPTVCAEDGGYVSFSETATVAGSTETCTASYTIVRGVNTFKCDCQVESDCSAASLKLQADGTSCFQSFN